MMGEKFRKNAMDPSESRTDFLNFFWFLLPGEQEDQSGSPPRACIVGQFCFPPLPPFPPPPSLSLLCVLLSDFLFLISPLEQVWRALNLAHIVAYTRLSARRSWVVWSWSCGKSNQLMHICVGAVAIRGALARAGVHPYRIEECFMGNGALA